MKKDYALWFAVCSLILIIVGMYVDDIDKKIKTEYSYARCSLKGYSEEFKKYKNSSREWINVGTYRKDTVYELDKLGNVTRGYELVFNNKDDYNSISCRDVLKVDCSKEDEKKLTKFVYNDENMYDFMDTSFYEKIDSLERNGYQCVKE